MDYREKYEQALENLKRIKKANRDNKELVDFIEYQYPELKESEGEKVRKWLIEMVEALRKANPTNASHNGNCSEAISWLEKQGEQKPYGQRQECADCQFNYAGECKGSCAMKRGEQKPADKVEPKFKVGDIITPKDKGHEPWQIMQVDISEKKYRFKDGYVIHFSQEDNYELIEQNAWSEEDDIMVHDIDYALRCQITYPISKLQSMSNWILNLKERVQSQSKQEWSEEDELNFNQAIYVCHQYGYFGVELWLKSLKQRMKGETK